MYFAIIYIPVYTKEGDGHIRITEIARTILKNKMK